MKYLLILTFFLLSTFSSANEVLLKINNQKINLTEKEKKWIKNHQVLRVHNENAWIPFNFYDKEPLGFSIDYMNLLADKIGIKIKYISGPSWSEFLTMMQNNQLDIMLNIVKTHKRSEFLDFTKPYKISKPRIYTKKNNSISSINELKGKTIALEDNFAITEYLKIHYPEIKIKYFNNIENRLKAVSFNEVFATIATPEVAETILKKHIINNVIASAEINLKKKSLNNFQLRIATKKDNKTLINILNKAMDNISYNEKTKLEEKWFVNYNYINQKITKKEREYIDKNIFKVATTNNWAPFNFDTEENKLTGISTDYFNLISNKLDLKSHISIKTSFTDVINSIKKGSSDLTFSTTNTKEREEYSVFSNTYEKFPIAIATTNDKKFIPNASLLERKKVAVGKGYSSYYLLKEEYPHIKFIFTNNTKEALELVKKGKVYAAVDILPSLQFYINKSFSDHIKITGTTNLFFELKLMISKKHKELLSPINKAISSINNDEKNMIYRKWVLSTKEGIDPSVFYKILIFITIIFMLGTLWNYQILKSRKLIEKEKSKLKNILENIPVPIMIIEDKSKNIIFANEYASIQYTIPLEKLVNSNINIIYARTNENDEISQTLYKVGELINYETQYISPFNQTLNVLLSLVPLAYDEKNCHLVIISDITKLKKVENEIKELNSTLEDRITTEVNKNKVQQLLMLHQSRHAQMGEMISMIAHQWRQPINILSLILQNILFKYEDNKLDKQKLQEYINKGDKQINTMSKTIDDFRNFFKPNKSKVKFSVNDILDQVLDILNPILLDENIKTTLKFKKNVKIIGYPNEFAQALINIITNSKDALVENNITYKKLVITLEQTKTKTIIDISDNAGGIKKSIITNIFKPYFSTKLEKNGTGLGLYMSKLIIEDEMHGKIKVINKKDGVSFKLVFKR
ncbi:MAG: hypothetical protein CL623_03190 [Arcobacter sp.]|nr:hypothetical protein [Arcobacter sp.]